MFSSTTRFIVYFKVRSPFLYLKTWRSVAFENSFSKTVSVLYFSEMLEMVYGVVCTPKSVAILQGVDNHYFLNTHFKFKCKGM